MTFENIKPAQLSALKRKNWLNKLKMLSWILNNCSVMPTLQTDFLSFYLFTVWYEDLQLWLLSEPLCTKVSTKTTHRSAPSEVHQFLTRLHRVCCIIVIIYIINTHTATLCVYFNSPKMHAGKSANMLMMFTEKRNLMSTFIRLIKTLQMQRPCVY